MLPSSLLSLPDDLLRIICYHLHPHPLEYPSSTSSSLSFASSCSRLQRIFREAHSSIRSAYTPSAPCSLYVPTPAHDLSAALALISVSLLHLSTTSRDDKWLYKFASIRPPLLSLTLTDLTPKFPLHLALTSTLKSLTLISTPLQALCSDHLSAITSKSPHLTSLSLTFATFPLSLEPLFSILSPHLSKLHISATRFSLLTISDTSFLSILAVLKALHTLHLSRFDADFASQLPSACSQLSLHSLNLSEAILRPAHVLALSTMRPAQFFLTQTHLSTPPYIFPAVNHLGSCLVSLRISMPLGERLLRMLAEKCALLSDLRCPLASSLTEDVIRAGFLVLAPRLQTLTLTSHARVSDAKLQGLVLRILAHRSSALRELRVTAEDLDTTALGCVMRECTKLEGVALRFSGRETALGMDLDIVREARKRLMWMKIVDVDREEDRGRNEQLWEACTGLRLRGTRVTIRGIEYGGGYSWAHLS